MKTQQRIIKQRNPECRPYYSIQKSNDGNEWHAIEGKYLSLREAKKALKKPTYKVVWTEEKQEIRSKILWGLYYLACIVGGSIIAIILCQAIMGIIE